MFDRIRKNPILVVLLTALLIVVIIGVFTPRHDRLTAGFNLGAHLGKLRGALNIETMSNEPCVVLFYAPWCGHCKRFKPQWDSLMAKNHGIKLIDVNCDKNKELAEKHNIKGFPTIKYLPKGLDVSEGSEYNGDRSEESLNEFIKKCLNRL